MTAPACVRWVDIWKGRVLSGASRGRADRRYRRRSSSGRPRAPWPWPRTAVCSSQPPAGSRRSRPTAPSRSVPTCSVIAPIARLNDGSVDPQGRFVVGSLALGAETGEEVLLRVSADGAVETLRERHPALERHRLLARRRHDLSRRHLASTVSRHSYGPGEFDHDEPWDVVLDDLPELSRRPDRRAPTATCGSRSAADPACAATHPTGELLDVVTIDAAQATCPAFVGPDLDILAITSAQKGLESWTDRPARSSSPTSAPPACRRAAGPAAPPPPTGRPADAGTRRHGTARGIGAGGAGSGCRPRTASRRR